MTSQPTRRVRRRQFTEALQEQQAGAKPVVAAPASTRTTRRAPAAHREHHVTTDYSYVRKDLWTILGVSVVTLGFIVGMSFVV